MTDKNAATSPSGIDIADWLRERIRRGRLVPAQRLIEADITRETGASRSKVREAFQRLEGEGLVIIEEFRGASVKRISVEEVRQIYRARVALEGISAGDFTLAATSRQKQKLSDLQDELDQCAKNLSPERFARLNQTWHDHIIAGSGNAVVRDVLNRLSVPINRVLFERFYDEKWLLAANADHQKITAAILANDADGAEDAMRRHIQEGFRTFSLIASEFGR